MITWPHQWVLFCLCKQFLFATKFCLNSLISFCSETVYFHLHYKCRISTLYQHSIMQRVILSVCPFLSGMQLLYSALLKKGNNRIRKTLRTRGCQTKEKHAAVLMHSHLVLGIVIHLC